MHEETKTATRAVSLTLCVADAVLSQPSYDPPFDVVFADAYLSFTNEVGRFSSTVVAPF